jgi:hypothetical protein
MPVKNFRDKSPQGDEVSGAASAHAVPGRSTLVEQLPAIVAPAQRALDASAPQVGSSETGASLPRLNLGPPRDKGAGGAVPGAGTGADQVGSPLPRLDLGPPSDKAVGTTAAGKHIGGPREGNPEGGAKDDGVKPPAEKKKKKAGVESFTVDWAKGATAGPTAANLRLDYNAKFKKDDDHDPALAEFRQNAMTKWQITDGPNKGAKGDTSPLHNDNYSRADDLSGHKITDQLFYSNDNPGWDTGEIDKDDVLDYAFTAEQMIIDTSDGNKVIEKRGPHTATIKGKDPRAYGSVPKKLG